MREPFTRGQKRVFTVCFLCYAAAYVGRLNLSAALTGLADSLALTDAQCGLFQTAFALVYAAGQIINGSLADRISASRYIGVGLLLSALCNALFGVTRSYGVLVALWALNGAAQSMLWTPIVKLLAAWFHGERRSRASFGLSITMILGHLVAWGVAGALASALGWRYAFFVPTVVLAAAGAMALLTLRDRPDDARDEPERPTAPARFMPVGRMLRATGLAALLGCCVCDGFVRDGVVTWAPMILARGGGSLNPTLVSLIIPVLNLLGILLMRRCYRLLKGSARGATGALMIVSAAFALLLLPTAAGGMLCALLMGLCCAANYGVNPLLTTLVPMEYENAGRVGMVAGLIDSFIYVGSALAGVATGALSDAAGWTGVYAVWGGVSLLAAALAFVSLRGREALKRS